MNAKQITFEVLDTLPEVPFSGAYLAGKVCGIEGRIHYPDTILRYMREWRKKREKFDIVLVDKKKSIYKKIKRS